jgi:sorbose reductase
MHRKIGKHYKVEVENAEEVETALLPQTQEFNGLDVFVANAEIPWIEGPVIDGSLELYRKVMSINLDGAYYRARAADRVWKRQQIEGTDILERSWRIIAMAASLLPQA